MIKKFTIRRDELRPGDFPVAAEPGKNLITIYREIPEFGTSAELEQAKKTLSNMTQVAHQYFAQARRLKGLGAHRLANNATLHGERILATLRNEEVKITDIHVDPELEAEVRASAARGWSAWLDLAATTTLDDGTPLLKAVFEHNPELAARFKAIFKEKK